MSASTGAIVGTGLIGGSIGLALRGAGTSPATTATGAGSSALELGRPRRGRRRPDAELTFVATPVRAVAGGAVGARRTTAAS